MRRSRVIGAATVAGLLLAWELVSDTGLAPTVVLPPPHAVLTHAAFLVGPGSVPPYALEHDVGLTLARLALGLALAIAAGVPLGIAMGFSGPLRAVFLPLMGLLMPIPALALVPILMLLTGIGELTEYTIVFLTAVVPIVMTVYDGVRTVNRFYYWTAGSFGADRRQVFWHVTLPATVLPVVNGCRLGAGYAWRSLIATEGITALTGGLGYTIFQARNFFDTQTIYVDMAAIALLGLLMEGLLFTRVEQRTAARWGMISDEH